MAKYKWHLANLVAFIRLNLFVKIRLKQWIDQPYVQHTKDPPIIIQGGSFLKITEINATIYVFTYLYLS